MSYIKRYLNGLKLVFSRTEGMYSVSVGVMTKTGSVNESKAENGISHFIEHVLFKGTKKRSAFEISDYIDRIGAQINAFTSKELTCYYTKSTIERLEDSIEVLSDIFFDSIFLKEELEREKGVVLEEINMSEDTPEDLCFDLLSKSYYGDEGLGKTILGSAKNVKSFDYSLIKSYMDKYYKPNNGKAYKENGRKNSNGCSVSGYPVIYKINHKIIQIKHAGMDKCGSCNGKFIVFINRRNSSGYKCHYGYGNYSKCNLGRGKTFYLSGFTDKIVYSGKDHRPAAGGEKTSF